MKQDTIENRSGELMSIALSLLVPSSRNVRKTNGTDVSDLKASIEAQGLLQNLIVVAAKTKAGQTQKYEVVGGKRRLTALKALAKEKKIAADEPILCRVKPSEAAALASLTENVQRELMHLADEFDAFQALIDEGRTVEDIALTFGTSELTVRRRLKLARLHPDLLALYRQGGIHLDQLMALALCDDQAMQLRAWTGATHWNRDAASLREKLTDGEVDAVSDSLALFVGIEAYEAAGGPVRRDLFSDAHAGYLQDAALLSRLAGEKLEQAAEAVRAEGWSWVEAVPRASGVHLYDYGRAPKSTRSMTKAEAKRRKGLETRIDALREQSIALNEQQEADEAEQLDAQIESAEAELEALEQSLVSYEAAAIAQAGAIVCVGLQGDLQVHRGLVRREARRSRTGASRPDRDAEGDCQDDKVGAERGDSATARPAFSAALMMELTRQYTLAVRAALLDNPSAAMTALLHCLVQRLLYEPYPPACTALRLVPNAQDARLGSAEDGQGRAAVELNEARTHWAERLPGDPSRLLPWLAALGDADRQDLLALCVALTVNGVRDRQGDSELDGLASLLELDMADWWQPTAAGYFERVTKDAILSAIAEGAGDDAAKRIRGVSKSELARVAERELQDKRWLPEPLRRPVEASDAMR